MILEITIKPDEVNLMPASELEEIAQNVKMIILTQKFSVPMDREFGINGRMIDEPIASAQARLSAEFAAAIRKFEPRARLQKAFFVGDETDGQLNVRLRLEVVEKKLRGYV